MWLLLVCLASAADPAPLANATVKFALSANSSATGSVKVSPTYSWGTSDDSDPTRVRFHEQALGVWMKAATPDGTGAVELSDAIADVSGGVAYSLLRKETQSLAAADPGLEAKVYAAVEACRAACAANGTASANDVIWCKDPNNTGPLAGGSIDSSTQCEAGTAAVNRLQVSPRTSNLPVFSGATIEIGTAVQNESWVDVDSEGVATEAQGLRIPYTAELRAIKGLDAGANWVLLGLNIGYKHTFEENDAAQWCTEVGALTTDEGLTTAVESCSEAPLGTPAQESSLAVKGGIGVMPDGLARWRASVYPGVTFDLTPGAESRVTAYDLAVLTHLHLGRVRPESYNGTYKGILAFGPTLAFDPTAEEPWRPSLGLAVTVLAHKYLIDPSVGI